LIGAAGETRGDKTVLLEKEKNKELIAIKIIRFVGKMKKNYKKKQISFCFDLIRVRFEI
jgi:hypothetical protein